MTFLIFSYTYGNTQKLITYPFDDITNIFVILVINALPKVR